MQTQYKRKKYFLNKKFQGSYALVLFSILIIMLFLSTIAIYMFIEGSVLEKFSEVQTKGEIAVAQRIYGLYKMRANTRDNYYVDSGSRSEAQLISANNIDKLGKILRQSRKNILPILVCMIILISIASIYISHKIAGPLFRLEKSIAEIKNKNLDAVIHLRKGDQLGDLVDGFNDMAEVFDNDIKEAKELIVSCKKNENVSSNLEKLDKLFSEYKTSMEK